MLVPLYMSEEETLVVYASGRESNSTGTVLKQVGHSKVRFKRTADLSDLLNHHVRYRVEQLKLCLCADILIRRIGWPRAVDIVVSLIRLLS